MGEIGDTTCDAQRDGDADSEFGELVKTDEEVSENRALLLALLMVRILGDGRSSR
jgi:hypothetical protein